MLPDDDNDNYKTERNGIEVPFNANSSLDKMA
jgi:hypothetical protein